MNQPRVDAEVIAACREGDREAFRQLFEAYKDRVYSMALYFFNGDEASAKDTTQQVFLKLITCMSQFRQQAEFSTWLYRMVTNTCLDEQRRRRRFVLFGDDVPVVPMVERKSQEAHCRRLEISEAVQAVIAGLKPKLRMAILLKYFEDMSYEEMAEVLGVSKGTVASRLNRGHQILARKLAHLRGALAAGE